MTNNNTPKLAAVYHFDLYGKREDKYDFLQSNSLQSIEWTLLQPVERYYFFVPKDFDVQKEYDKGFKIDELFPVNSAGIVTARDTFTIHFTKEEVVKTVNEFLQLDDEAARKRFDLGKDVRDWSVEGARNDLQKLDLSNVQTIIYRPFEERFTYYTGVTKGFHCMPRSETMRHLFKKENVALICPKQVPEKEEAGVFITKYVAGHKTSSAYNINNIFPLYLYPDNDGQQNITEKTERVSNLNKEIVAQIEKGLGETFEPIDLLDYIYAVLHSPSYREQYKEFLKIDFPRVPYPDNAEVFWKLVALGGRLSAKRTHSICVQQPSG